MDFDIEERAQQAIDNFNAGYNCAQSVFLTYYDLLGLDLETAKCMSVSFGGGMGRMREVCGTISAMCMLAGFRYPVVDPKDQEARTRNYGMVQKMPASSKRSMALSYAEICFRPQLPPNGTQLLPYALLSIMRNARVEGMWPKPHA